MLRCDVIWYLFCDIIIIIIIIMISKKNLNDVFSSCFKNSFFNCYYTTIQMFNFSKNDNKIIYSMIMLKDVDNFSLKKERIVKCLWMERSRRRNDETKNRNLVGNRIVNCEWLRSPNDQFKSGSIFWKRKIIDSLGKRMLIIWWIHIEKSIQNNDEFEERLFPSKIQQKNPVAKRHHHFQSFPMIMPIEIIKLDHHHNHHGCKLLMLCVCVCWRNNCYSIKAYHHYE